jgi:HK97 family phage major capsid protein
MDTLSKLLEDRAQIHNRREARNNRAESEGRDFNEQETADEAEDTAKFGELSNRIKRIKDLATQKNMLEEERHEPSGGSVVAHGHIDQPTKPAAGAAPRVNPGGVTIDSDAQIDISPRCFAQPMQNFKDTVDGRRDAYRCGQWILATLLYNKENPTRQCHTARKWCKDAGIPIEFDPEARFKDDYSVQASLNEGGNFGGGYLVIPEFERTIIQLRSQFGYFRRNARNWPMGSDTLYIPRLSAVPTATWTTDTGSQSTPESDPSWDQVTLTAQELSCICKWSISLDQDAIVSLADILAGEISYAFSYAEDNAGFNGDGTSKYGGIDGILNKITQSKYAASVYQSPTAGHSSFGTLTLPDFHNIVGNLPTYAEEFGGGPKWYISRPGFAASMETLQYAAGGNTVVTVSGESDRARAWMKVFLGYEVELIPVMNRTLTAQTGVVSCLFGNMALSSAIGTRRGIYFYVSRDRYMEFRQLAIIGVERVAINNHSLISPPNLETQSGPINALQFSAS